MFHFHKFFLRALLVVAVAGPAFWLVFSDDGQRRFDLFLLKVTTGLPAWNTDLNRLHPGLTEERLRAALAGMPLQCQNRATDLGERVCQMGISAFNGNPARRANFYFAGGGLTAVKVIYRRAYHRRLLAELRTTFGAPQLREAGGGPDAIAQWSVGGGVLMAVAQERLELDEEPALLWLAR